MFVSDCVPVSHWVWGPADWGQSFLGCINNIFSVDEIIVLESRSRQNHLFSEFVEELHVLSSVQDLTSGTTAAFLNQTIN